MFYEIEDLSGIDGLTSSYLHSICKTLLNICSHAK